MRSRTRIMACVVTAICFASSQLFAADESSEVKIRLNGVKETEIAKAKEMAMVVFTAMFINMKPVLIEPDKIVFDVKVSGGRTCTVTMVHEAVGTDMRWVASDVGCAER